MILVYIIITAIVVASAATYLMVKFVKMEDQNNNNIPDVVDKKIEAVKYKTKRIKEEVGDVVNASKEVIDQIKDIKEAANGEARKGRKKQ
jgi:hypothetical protein